MGNAPVKGNAGPVTSAMIKDVVLQKMTTPPLSEGDTPPPATLGEPFPAGNLWQNQPAVVFVVRRPGCPLCREHAIELSEKKPEFDALGVRLVGIVHEKLGVEEFQTGFFKNGEIYFDKEKEFFSALGLRWSPLSAMLKPRVMKNVQRVMGKGVKGNQAGEGRLLGGLLVVGQGDSGVAFEHREKVFGDHSSVEDIMAACSKCSTAEVPEPAAPAAENPTL